MKLFIVFTLLITAVFNSKFLYAQNVMINVLTQNSGVVKVGGVIFFEVTINNTSPTRSVPPYKIKPTISFPLNLITVEATGHQLPVGWKIISNKNGVITLSNGTDVIPENQSRTILIAIKGKAKGGPSTIVGNLLFSNGESPGSAKGSALIGDNIADNSSTSSVKVE